jgi:hypothetical protein
MHRLSTCPSRHSTSSACLSFFHHRALMQDSTRVSAHLSHQQSKHTNNGSSCGSKGKGSAETRREVVEIRAFRTRAPRSCLERSASPTSPLPDQTHHERKDSSHIILHLRNQESYRRGKTAIPPPIRARVMTIRWSGGAIRLLFAGSE